MHKRKNLIYEEVGGWSLRLFLANRITCLISEGGGGRLRASLYRLLGLRIGRGTLIAGPLTFGPTRGFYQRVQIGARCFINSPVYLDAAEDITIGDGVSIGHHVVLITTDHAIGSSEFRAGHLQPRPITIESGVWIAANVTVLPGITVGQGAVVAAGAVVTRDVPPNTLVGGVPARVLRALSE